MDDQTEVVEVVPPADAALEIRPSEADSLDLRSAESVRTILQLWLSSLKKRSRRIYEMSVRLLAQRLNLETEAFVAKFLSDVSWAHTTAAAYRAWMLEPIHKDPPRPLSPSTARTRIAALRSLVSFAGHGDDGLRVIDWSLTTKLPPNGALRDMSGPPAAKIPQILSYGGVMSQARDQAILRLLYSSGLRRGEVAALELADVDVRGGVHVMGKGKMAKEFVPIPPGTQRALVEWIKIRGDWPGPLFHNISRAHKPEQGLSDKGIEGICAKAGAHAGVKERVRPHGLRHAAVTALLEKKNGNIREVQRWSRHARADTVQIYDDRRRSREGVKELASMLEPVNLDEEMAEVMDLVPAGEAVSLRSLVERLRWWPAGRVREVVDGLIDLGQLETRGRGNSLSVARPADESGGSEDVQPGTKSSDEENT